MNGKRITIAKKYEKKICIDRKIPVIVQNIDGPSEIVDKVKEFVIMYDVDKEDISNDINNVSRPETSLGRSGALYLSGVSLGFIRCEVF